MHLFSRIALLGLSFASTLACQMANPAYDLGDAEETRGDGDGDPSSSGESKTTTADGDADTLAGDGDGDGDADPTMGDGDGDADPTTGDGDGDGDPTTGDGDGDAGVCGDDVLDPGEECDDGNSNSNDGCSNSCLLEDDMQMCAQIDDPTTCADCLNGFCCSPKGLACAQSDKCQCMLPCLLNNNNALLCAQECEADPAVVEMAVDTFACAQAHCPAQCIEG